MACLVVGDAKYVAGVGRGAHRARTSGETPRGMGHPTPLPLPRIGTREGVAFGNCFISGLKWP
eukprot:2630795-Pyramimonas_sp.AAC.1